MSIDPYKRTYDNWLNRHLVPELHQNMKCDNLKKSYYRFDKNIIMTDMNKYFEFIAKGSDQLTYQILNSSCLLVLYLYKIWLLIYKIFITL